LEDSDINNVVGEHGSRTHTRYETTIMILQSGEKKIGDIHRIDSECRFEEWMSTEGEESRVEGQQCVISLWRQILS
jgi:hypothetical protein